MSATVNLTNSTAFHSVNGKGNLSPFGDGNFMGLNESHVLKIVKDALRKYDADKTGMVDHALSSAGGNVLSTRCTEALEVSHVNSGLSYRIFECYNDSECG